MKALALLVLLALSPSDSNGCTSTTDEAANQQSQAQAQSLLQANEAVGMPAITHWQERRMVKDLPTRRSETSPSRPHAYLVNEMRGCPRLHQVHRSATGCRTAPQFTAPEKDIYATTSSSVHHNIPQPEPNGLYIPEAAEGTWLLMKDPGSPDVKPVYFEPRIVVTPFRLPDMECAKDTPAAKAGK